MRETVETVGNLEWYDKHVKTPRTLELEAEVAILRKRLEEAERCWAAFKHDYPWTIQPYDDMQMDDDAVAALERLAAVLAPDDTSDAAQSQKSPEG